MRMNEEQFERRAMFNDLKEKVSSECRSFDAKYISFSIVNERDSGGLHYFDFEVEFDVTNLRKSDEVESLKVCIKSDLLSTLMDYDETYSVGDIKFIVVGKPKKGGLFSKFF